MATLTASAAQTGEQPMANLGINVRSVSYPLSAALSAGDVVQMVLVPAGAKVCGGRLAFNGTGNAVALTVGDGGDVDRFLASASASLSNHWFDTAIQDYSYSADDTIDVVIGTVTSATATGTLELMVMYTYNQEV